MQNHFVKNANSAGLAKAYIRFEEKKHTQSRNIMQKTEDVLNGKAPDMTRAGSGNVFPVQFNPVELQFSTERGSKKKKKDLQEKEEKPSLESCILERIPGIHMSVKLILDARFSETNDVQRKTEGLIAAGKNSTRELKASFCWESFVFTGILETVSAEYTMFDGQGHPVRADIDFTISLTDKEKMAEIMNSDYHALFQ